MSAEEETEAGRAEEGTRERILHCALRLFAARGYRATSVRRITEAAGVNVAAVHYHFGGKEPLYLALLRERAAAIRAVRLEALEGRQDLDSSLRAFVRSFFVGAEEGAEEMELFFREMVSPGPGFEILMREMIEPIRDAFTAILVREVEGMTPARARLCLASVIGQLAQFLRSRGSFPALFGKNYDQSAVEEVVEHVVSFSLHGIHGKGDS